ncbi:PP2C family protein-serine/threonine phosphatase [Streptomyces sp. NPDC014684]|uniref:PP2C family protein-serine/threonine phosphatase n=1 Tax=Streptomyces sp. NPDC014684 TaxID=3364880 RepID=UPI0036FD82CA
MGSKQRRPHDWAPAWQSRHAVLLLPVVLIIVITVAGVVTPSDIVLGPLLVIAPTLTAWSMGPWTTAGIGVLAVAAQAGIGWRSGLLLSRGEIVQLIALAALTALVVALSVVRERRLRQLAQVRSVSEAAQHVLMWPLPKQLGPLRLASVYLAAAEEAEIGGDLYAAARTESAVRVLIGDVRGKGLPAIGEAALVLSAFREAAHRHASLPELAHALELSVGRYLADFEPLDEAGERFVTALLVEIPDDEPVVRLTSCGHLAPVVLQPGGRVSSPRLHPAPPLGIGLTGPESHSLDVMPFGTDDTLLLYTDGVIEARNHHGAFYPLAERAAQWTISAPQALLHHIQRDLTAHTSGRLSDDIALIALHRARRDPGPTATN